MTRGTGQGRLTITVPPPPHSTLHTRYTLPTLSTLLHRYTPRCWTRSREAGRRAAELHTRGSGYRKQSGLERRLFYTIRRCKQNIDIDMFVVIHICQLSDLVFSRAAALPPVLADVSENIIDEERKLEDDFAKEARLEFCGICFSQY